MQGLLLPRLAVEGKAIRVQALAVSNELTAQLHFVQQEAMRNLQELKIIGHDGVI